MKKKTSLIISILSLLLFVLLMILIKIVDLKAIGPEGTLVGFATLNNAFHNLTGVDYFLYDVTDLLGYVAIMMCGIFGFIGLFQWIRRKKILEVDAQIIILGILFIITIGLYVLFTVVAINYRPVIMPDELELEPSFPSSHTVLSVVAFGATSMIIGDYIKDKKIGKVAKIVLNTLLVLTIVGRLLSGIHWFTDIIGGLLLSLSLLLAYKFIIANIKPAKTIIEND